MLEVAEIFRLHGASEGTPIPDILIPGSAPARQLIALFCTASALLYRRTPSTAATRFFGESLPVEVSDCKGLQASWSPTDLGRQTSHVPLGAVVREQGQRGAALPLNEAFSGFWT